MSKLYMHDVADFLNINYETCKRAKLQMPEFSKIFEENVGRKHRFSTTHDKYDSFLAAMGGEEKAVAAIKSASTQYGTESLKKNNYIRKSRTKPSNGYRERPEKPPEPKHAPKYPLKSEQDIFWCTPCQKMHPVTQKATPSGSRRPDVCIHQHSKAAMKRKLNDDIVNGRVKLLAAV